MSNTEKGEWRLVTAEGCEDGSLAALNAVLESGRFDPLRVRVGSSKVKFSASGPVWQDGSPIALGVLVCNQWQVFHPAPKPLTHAEWSDLRTLRERWRAGDSTDLEWKKAIDGALSRSLPEFPRRIPFSERLPPDGETVVCCLKNQPLVLCTRYNLVLAEEHRPGNSVSLDRGIWWHPIAGPDAGDDE